MDEKKKMGKEEEKEQVMGVWEDEADEEENFIVRFEKPYLFEGREYTEVDLSGMEDMTGADMIALNRMMARAGVGGASPEVTLEYACYFAARAANLPIEFFTGLRPREILKVKNRVVGFLFAWG